MLPEYLWEWLPAGFILVQSPRRIDRGKWCSKQVDQIHSCPWCVAIYLTKYTYCIFYLLLCVLSPSPSLSYLTPPHLQLHKRTGGFCLFLSHCFWFCFVHCPTAVLPAALSELWSVFDLSYALSPQVLDEKISDFRLPDVALVAERSDPVELGRLLQLILGCAVRCERKQGMKPLVWHKYMCCSII